jgi:hypothetical protein
MAICTYAAGIDMTQDEIIEMTRQAGGFDATPKFLERFAKLVAAKALSERQRNFCSRCGKRTKDSTHIHTCTPPQD